MNDYSSLLDTLGNYKANNNDDESFYDNLYTVLGCVPESTLEQISIEYKKRVLTCHPDRLKLHEDKSAEFHKLLTAYKILSDPTERAQYDKWRNSSIKVPYLMWKGLGAQAQAVHWRVPRERLAIDNECHGDKEGGLNQSIITSSPMTVVYREPEAPFWKNSDTDDLYEKFRNYEI
ncbi:2902_t:CDS:2 [Paraglomus brasilianum]|uniref:2902_t:CDS:1 n=1 Tax=Paraglomus brasilianum TaxID=144538 RepID=A0A9N8VTR0_9GLOM|nr:2902_t:CDS:2 [Paraglomus brasilianum]